MTQEHEYAIQELRHQAEEQPAMQKLIWKRQLSQQSTYEAEIHELYTEMLNMREKSEMQLHLAANMCKLENSVPSRSVESEPEDVLNTRSPGRCSRWNLPEELETPNRPTSSGLQSPVGIPVQLGPSPQTREYGHPNPCCIPPAQWGDMHTGDREEECELFGDVPAGHDSDIVGNPFESGEHQDELDHAAASMVEATSGARCVNGNLMRPMPAEEEAPSTACRPNVVNAPGGVALGRGPPGFGKSPGSIPSRQIAPPPPPPPPPPAPPDYRWGENVSHVDVDPPTQGSQCPAADPQPQCAAAAMMHGVSRPAASSWQGGCTTIAEHQKFRPPVPPQYVILPNPGYKIQANLWNLYVQVSARNPGPLASFLHHCNTMDSPYIPSYGRGGTQPADDIGNLDRHASMENLKELQKYSERLQFEATCCRLWAEGIQNQIMDEQEKVQTWISNMTDELIRLKKIQPAWIHQLQTQGGPPAPPTSMGASSIQQHQPASSSAASTITVKQAPMSRNASMASAPQNAPFPPGMGADPWADAMKKKQHRHD